ncbi:MAG TPA: tRNA (adenosine(37)-N6)-threonylcarbamoyltransferase complex ATPase subunit type 1 TsaE, partial [Clostridia bacterium]|nr:tRNA (adenosine(37)-N6)-threonylcarbamoyltransferase complex ATPase subunit type 1 TsaE [Clostridia bacterium]
LAWPGMNILLSGDLGVGKTVLARGISRGLDIDVPVTSPTYTLIHEYYGRLPLYHFDIYRLSHAEEIYDLGSDEFFDGDGVTVVEWPERMEDLGPREYLDITIERVSLGRACSEAEDKRLIRIKSVGKRYEELERVLVEI